MEGISHFITTFIDSFDLFIVAMFWTIAVTVCAFSIALVFGLFFGFLKVSKIKPLMWISDFYVWIIRGTPLVVQIFVLFYGLTNIVLIPTFWAVTIGLAFHVGGYLTEIIRGSIESIDDGQMEAGRSLGMSASLTMRRIILPQAFRRAIPSLGNQFIIALKDSALASFIGMQELFGVANLEGSTNFDFMTYLLIVSVYYLFIVYVFTFFVKILEKRLKVSN
ncbi:amino acid ABC transporter permease [Ammoniphilus sp. CFH 90114]|uniref:amino acid ABC transporter permease n=1 Tax=Ammoniphilus sp. CFH 90114 TaxID=2493665 RepID=UPI00100FA55A|nr:amino acid ABC transporter permease [Ammoniphilus sp. CFH 90114]RXT07880.1 amino acid ABC transporter permease [Ammoniphilus sp. CFH 90114]